MTSRTLGACVLLMMMAAVRGARAEDPVPVVPMASATAAQSTPVTIKTASGASLTIGGYVEASYQWNFNNPSNFITNYRGFDNRHNVVTIDNAVLDVQGARGAVSTHLVLQIGNTPNTYYLAEPVWRATGGAGPSNPSVWQNLQQANLAYVAPVGAGLTVDAGLFLSPIGPESLAIKDQWNWSRSDLFFGLPFYHAGVRATYPVTPELTVSLQLYNGWNSVIDSNLQVSPAVQVVYAQPDKLTWSALYFGGVERPAGAPEGEPWRHLFDTHLTVYPLPWLAAQGHFDAGFEHNRFGTSGWAAGAASLRVQAQPWLYVAGRGDVFREWIASNASGTASPVFWAGSAWISSGTLTLDARPASDLSFRIEYRHDQADHPLFFEGEVATDADGNYVANARSQDTITAGATAWF